MIIKEQQTPLCSLHHSPSSHRSNRPNRSNNLLINDRFTCFSALLPFNIPNTTASSILLQPLLFSNEVSRQRFTNSPSCLITTFFPGNLPDSSMGA